MITTREKFDKISDVVKKCFIFCKITNNFYLMRMYGSRGMHPIGYHIIVPVFIKDA